MCARRSGDSSISGPGRPARKRPILLPMSNLRDKGDVSHTGSPLFTPLSLILCFYRFLVLVLLFRLPFHLSVLFRMQNFEASF